MINEDLTLPPFGRTDRQGESKRTVKGHALATGGDRRRAHDAPGKPPGAKTAEATTTKTIDVHERFVKIPVSDAYLAVPCRTFILSSVGLVKSGTEYESTCPPLTYLYDFHLDARDVVIDSGVLARKIQIPK